MEVWRAMDGYEAQSIATIVIVKAVAVIRTIVDMSIFEGI